jgi:hypothetical protein
MELDTYEKRLKLQRDQWGEIYKLVPYISFPYTWEVAIIPPFLGATARFLVRRRNTKENVSIYLDWHANLGCMNQPYYEIYPSENDEPERFLLNETDKMILAIEEALIRQDLNRFSIVYYTFHFKLWKLLVNEKMHKL